MKLLEDDTGEHLDCVELEDNLSGTIKKTSHERKYGKITHLFLLCESRKKLWNFKFKRISME